jgi:hypothetical protein
MAEAFDKRSAIYNKAGTDSGDNDKEPVMSKSLEAPEGEWQFYNKDDA